MSTLPTRSLAATIALGVILVGTAAAQAQTSTLAPEAQRTLSTSTPDQTQKSINAATPATPAAPKAGTAATPATPSAKATEKPDAKKAADTATDKAKGKVKTN